VLGEIDGGPGGGPDGGEAVATEVRGNAYRTGRHTFELDPDDPLGTGFQVR
jgi:proline racemase